ncbi:MAG: YEATS-associated helix-containing protein [Chitinophagaceae bacterium]
MDHLNIIILIIVFSGLLGGLTNFFLSFDIENSRKECWINFFKAVLLSLCSSVTVPLFLQIISNNLLDNSVNASYPEKNYFILAGFCILASIYSKRFLDDLYDRVKKVEDKADKAEKKVQNLEESGQEIENVNELLQIDNAQLSNLESTYSKEQLLDVINAIIESKYSYRTVGGIAKSSTTGLTRMEVVEILRILKSEGVVESKINRNGNETWRVISSKKLK